MHGPKIKNAQWDECSLRFLPELIFDGPAMFPVLSRVSASLLLGKYEEYRLLDWGFQDLQGLLGKEKLRVVDQNLHQAKAQATFLQPDLSTFTHSMSTYWTLFQSTAM